MLTAEHISCCYTCSDSNSRANTGSPECVRRPSWRFSRSKSSSVAAAAKALALSITISALGSPLDNAIGGKSFLGSNKRLVGHDRLALLTQIATIPLGYFQNDLVSEETLKAWGSKTSKKYVDISTHKKIHNAAQLFIE
ncbi:unnamed protein product [Penicillium discolor]